MNPTCTLSRAPILALVPVALVLGTGCFELATPRDVTGNFDVSFEDNLRVYVNDTLVAEVESGVEGSFEWDGQVFRLDQVCGDEGVDCPAEVFWNTVAIDQPWGAESQLLNIVNLDRVRGVGGERLGGRLFDDGHFDALSGLAVDGADNCAVLAIGTVHGSFSQAADTIDGGVLRYEYGAGCALGGQTLGGKLSLETDYTAMRTGDLDLSSVQAEPPVDEEGAPAS